MSKQHVIFFGCGAVSKCCIYYLEKFIKVKYNRVTIIDKSKRAFEFPTIKMAQDKGAKLLHYTITRKNLTTLLDDILNIKKHDIIIDLTTNTPTYLIVKECNLRNVLYINTSIEDDTPLHVDMLCPINSGIFLQHMNLQSISQKLSNTTTSLIEFGMNPGLISIFVKAGIMDIAKMLIKNQKKVNQQLLTYYKIKDYRNLAKLLKIRTIHCSEIDTQTPLKNTKLNGKFVNTWSCVGLITEGIEPAEIQIGTHEKILPFEYKNISQPIPQLITTKKAGMDIQMKSIVPLKIDDNGNIEFTFIKGRCIHHGEGISLNRYLGSFDYSPTMHYVYQLNPMTDKLLSNLSESELIDISKKNSNWKVLNMYDDKLQGYDNIGALFILEENPFTGKKESYCHWTGSILNTDYTLNILNDKYFGPTIIQVMAGILSGVKWMNKNKNQGVVFGEDVDDSFILKNIKKYMGKYYSGPVDLKLDGYTIDKLIESGQDKSSVRVKDL
jgi:homospermidine synthase